MKKNIIAADDVPKAFSVTFFLACGASLTSSKIKSTMYFQNLSLKKMEKSVFDRVQIAKAELEEEKNILAAIMAG